MPGDETQAVFEAVEKLSASIGKTSYQADAAHLEFVLDQVDPDRIDRVIYSEACWRLAVAHILSRDWMSAAKWYKAPAESNVDASMSKHARSLWPSFIEAIHGLDATLAKDPGFVELERAILSGDVYAVRDGTARAKPTQSP